MNKQDTQKLLKAGYRFVRTDVHLMAIKVQSHTDLSHGWKVLEKGFTTKKEMNARMQQLLEDEKTLEG